MRTGSISTSVAIMSPPTLSCFLIIPLRFWRRTIGVFYVVEMHPRENFEQYFNGYYRWLRDQSGAAEVAGLLAQRDISHLTLAGRPPMTPEKEKALGLATHQDTLDVQHRIQELGRIVFFA